MPGTNKARRITRAITRRRWHLASPILALATLPACSQPAYVPGPATTDPLPPVFAAEGATGTMVIRRLSDDREWVHNPERADSAFLPASTFKIANAAIALEIGVVSGPDEPFPWDGVERQFPAWNRDHTLHSAMTASAVPVYQEVARRIGAERMAEWLRRLDYGNADTAGGLETFWLTGDLRVSARQQIDFLARLITGALPLSRETVARLTRMLVAESGPGRALHGKTGWAFEAELGWWVGWTEVDGERYVFALNMDILDARADPPKRHRIGRALLEATGAWPSPELP
jgi:beta-lactamase class D